jgi:hypothetical protein
LFLVFILSVEIKMPKPKIPHGEKVSVLKAELRRMRNAEAPPISKMKKPEVVAELEKRKEQKRGVALAGLRKVEAEAKERTAKAKKDAEEVKGAMDFMKNTLEARELVERLNAPKKRKLKAEKKVVTI